MTWLGQIGHVARKDVRQYWWLILLYLAIVAAVTAIARSDAPVTSLLVTLDAFIVVAFGMATAATLVQSDSPSRSNAFWATRPLDPGAVFAAKLVLITLGVVGISVLGEIVGLQTLGLRAAEVGSLVMRSIGLYAIWLVAAITVAALTPDFRAFAITLLVVVVAFLALAQTLFADPYGVLHVSASVPAVGVLIALGALAYRYQRRDAPRTAWGMAGAGIFSAFVFLLAPPQRVSGRRAATPEPAPITLSGTGGVVDHDQLVLHLRPADGDSLHSYTFFCDTLIAHLRDGSALTLQPRFGTTYLQRAKLPAVGAVRWRPESRFRAIGLASYGLNDEERAALAPGVVAIELAGRVNEYVPEVAAAIPLRIGYSLARNGVRLRIGKILYPPDSFSIELTRTANANAQSFPLMGNDLPDPFTWGGETPNFALVNRVRGEGVALSSRSNEISNGWVVLPGAPIQQSKARLVPMPVSFPRDTIPRGRAWYSNAQLYVFHWTPGGTYRVHAHIAVP